MPRRSNSVTAGRMEFLTGTVLLTGVSRISGYSARLAKHGRNAVNSRTNRSVLRWGNCRACPPVGALRPAGHRASLNRSASMRQRVAVPALSYPAADAPKARVQHVPERIAQHVEAEDRHRDGQARINRDPGRV